LATSRKGEVHEPVCIYNKGNLLEGSMEGEVTRLVPARLARKGNGDHKMRETRRSGKL